MSSLMIAVGKDPCGKFYRSLCLRESELVRLFDLADYYRVVIPSPPRKCEGEVKEVVEEVFRLLMEVRSRVAFLVDFCERKKVSISTKAEAGS